MKWIMALILGVALGIVLPTAVDVRSGVWMHSWAAWGTIRPHAASPGLLLSIPLAIGSAIAFRIFFTWHRN